MNAINKFFTLNAMQTNCKKEPAMGDCWELSTTCAYQGRTQKRVVSFIRKIDGQYHVTLTGEAFKNFMAALASLMVHFVEVLRKLVLSMMCQVGQKTDDYTDIVASAVSTFLNRCPVPHLPTYDRGPKKEALHPLRRAVTEKMGGKYSR